MMNFDSLLQNKELKEILERYKEAISKRNEYELGFNVFALVSNTYYRENFHSEIISEILSPDDESKPKSKHKEGRLFLDAFLNYISDNYIGVDKKNYQNNVRVINESKTGGNRSIDILIQSDTHAVIIENKINDAGDQPNQLLDYYRDCKNKGKNVDLIIYLTKNGKKSPDYNSWTGSNENEIEEIKDKVKGMAAYDLKESSTPSLYKWLKKCISQSQNNDNKFILRQYKQLLKSLRGFIMETEALKEFYDLTVKNKDSITEIAEMYNKLYIYYPNLLKEKLFERPNPHYSYDVDYDETCSNENKLSIKNIVKNGKGHIHIVFKFEFNHDKISNQLYSIRIWDINIDESLRGDITNILEILDGDFIYKEGEVFRSKDYTFLTKEDFINLADAVNELINLISKE